MRKGTKSENGRGKCLDAEDKEWIKKIKNGGKRKETKWGMKEKKRY